METTKEPEAEIIENDENALEPTNKSKDTIEYSLINFTHHLLSLQISFEVTKQGFFGELKRLRRQLLLFLRKKANEVEIDGKRSFMINPESINEIDDLLERSGSTQSAFETFPQSYFISLFSCLDAHLVNCMRWVFLTKPEVLNGSGKAYTAKEILRDGSLEKIREMIVEDELLEFSQKSYVEQFTDLEKKHKVGIVGKLNCWPGFIELSARRNLLVHADGVVNDQYLSICEQNCIQTNGVKKDDQLTVNDGYFADSFKSIFQIGIVFGQELWRHFRNNELQSADQSLNKIGFDFLRFEKYELAQMVYEYGVSLNKISTDEYKKMFIINLAQAYKWRGENKKCQEIIQSVDWSSTSARFRMCCFTLLDDFANAYKTMRNIGNNPLEIGRLDYRTWPVFRKIREEKEFQDIFEEIFTEPYSIVKGKDLEIKDSSQTENPFQKANNNSCF